jgi:hypothetical protein
MNDERLRQILRQGDPAGEDGGLTPDEARAMRRTVLTAAPERKRRLLPVLALAGAVATAVLIAVFLLKPEPARPPAPPRIATAPPVVRIPAEPVPRPPQEKEERRPVPRHPRQHHHRRPTTPEVKDTLASLETTDAGTVERQVQFSTPGGTRIIWILKSGKASR